MFSFSDGVRKAMILVPTAVLPRTWRVAARRQLLANLELEIAERARLLIVAHPKSGNTWLKFMLTFLYASRHNIPTEELSRYSELALRNPEIPGFAATNGYYSYESAVGEKLSANAPECELRHKPVVLLARNPCDIAVSWYFQFTRRQSRHKQELINHAIEHPVDRKTISMWDFVRHSDIGLEFLIDYLNTWEQNLAGLDQSLILRYEDMRTKPAEVLKRIVSLMGDHFSDEDIDKAVEFGAFDNLRKLESEGFFRQGGMTLRNPKDPESFKVRRAKIGGFRDYFTPEQADELEQLMLSRLSPTFGYTATETSASDRVAV